MICRKQQKIEEEEHYAKIKIAIVFYKKKQKMFVVRV